MYKYIFFFFGFFYVIICFKDINLVDFLFYERLFLYWKVKVIIVFNVKE